MLSKTAMNILLLRKGSNSSLVKRTLSICASMNAGELKKPVVQTEIPVLTWHSAVDDSVGRKQTLRFATYFSA
jgi:hypothetical protein